MTVAADADIIGKNIRETGFRGRFDAAVIAVKRNNVKQVRGAARAGAGVVKNRLRRAPTCCRPRSCRLASAPLPAGPPPSAATPMRRPRACIF